MSLEPRQALPVQVHRVLSCVRQALPAPFQGEG